MTDTDATIDHVARTLYDADRRRRPGTLTWDEEPDWKKERFRTPARDLLAAGVLSPITDLLIPLQALLAQKGTHGNGSFGMGFDAALDDLNRILTSPAVVIAERTGS